MIIFVCLLVSPLSTYAEGVTVESLNYPLKLSNRIEQSLQVIETGQITGQVDILLSKETDKDVRLWYELYSVDDQMHLRNISSKDLFHGKIKANDPKTIEFSFDPLLKGQYQLKFFIQSVQDEGQSWGDETTVYFYVDGMKITKELLGVNEGNTNFENYNADGLFKIKKADKFSIQQKSFLTLIIKPIWGLIILLCLALALLLRFSRK